MSRRDNVKQGFAAIWSRMFGAQPESVQSESYSMIYWRNRLYRTIFGQIQFSGMPDHWDVNYFYDVLFKKGELCITDTAIGVVPLQCGHTGYNVFEHPTTCLIANPVLGSLTRTIDVDCAHIITRSDMLGHNDVVDRYATLLSMIDSAIMQNLFNTRVARMYRANSKKEADSYKEAYDEITSGKPAVFVGDSMGSGEWFDSQVKNHFIAADVHQLKVSILNDFYTEYGIRNSNTEKRERLVRAEVGAKDMQVQANIQNCVQIIQSGFDVANRLYGLNLNVSLLDTPTEGEYDTLQPDAVEPNGIG